MRLIWHIERRYPYLPLEVYKGAVGAHPALHDVVNLVTKRQQLFVEVRRLAWVEAHGRKLRITVNLHKVKTKDVDLDRVRCVLEDLDELLEAVVEEAGCLLSEMPIRNELPGRRQRNYVSLN